MNLRPFPWQVGAEFHVSGMLKGVFPIKHPLTRVRAPGTTAAGMGTAYSYRGYNVSISTETAPAIPCFSYTQIYAQRPPLLGLSGDIICTNRSGANMPPHSKTFSYIFQNTIVVFRILDAFFRFFWFFCVFWKGVHVFLCFFLHSVTSCRHPPTF